MSQFSLSSDASLLVRDGRGRYLPASADQILEAARQVIDQKMQRGTEFSSPAAVSITLREVRSMSLTPRFSSSPASWRLSAGCEKCSIVAARPKRRVSASVTK